MEMRNSTQKIFHLVQGQHFPEEIDSLSTGLQVKGHSKLASLSFVLIEGTLRVAGRIRHAPIPIDDVTSNTLAFQKEHSLSTSVVRYNHQTLGHAGCEHVLAAIRQTFWILQARIPCPSSSAQVC